MGLVNARFKETSILPGGRVFAFGDEGQISEEDAERLGDGVEVLGPATAMFQDQLDGTAPSEDAPAPEPEVETDPEAKVEPEPETKDAPAPENKMVSKAPVKK